MYWHVDCMDDLPESFDVLFDYIREWGDMPVRITASKAVDTNHGVILYSTWKGKKTIHHGALRIDFPIGDQAFSLSYAFKNRLLQAGMVVDMNWGSRNNTATHIFNIEWLDSTLDCEAIMDDETAFLWAIKHAASMKKLTNPQQVV